MTTLYKQLYHLVVGHHDIPSAGNVLSIALSFDDFCLCPFAALSTPCDLRLGGTILVGFTVQGSTLWVSHQDVPGCDGRAKIIQWMGYLEKKSVKLDVDRLLYQVAAITSDTTTYHHHILTTVPEMNASPFISRFLRGFLGRANPRWLQTNAEQLDPCVCHLSCRDFTGEGTFAWQWKLMKIALYDLNISPIAG